MDLIYYDWQAVQGGGHTIEDEGTPLTQRTELNFVGTGVTASDSGGKTQVSIPGGSGIAPASNDGDMVRYNNGGGVYEPTDVINIDGSGDTTILGGLNLDQLAGADTRLATINAAGDIGTVAADSDNIDNGSGVSGSTVSDALDNLETDVSAAQSTANTANAQDLQDIYDNGTDGIIITDGTNGAVIVRGGTGTNTDNNIEGKNNAGTTTFEVDGNGDVTANSYNGVGLTTGGAATNYLDETGNYSTPAGGGGAIANVWRDSDNSRDASPSGTLLTTGSVSPSSTSNVLYFQCSFAIYGTDGDEIRFLIKDGISIAYDTIVVANGTIQYVHLTAFRGISNTTARTFTFEVNSADGSIVFMPNSTDLAGAQQTRSDFVVMEMTLS